MPFLLSLKSGLIKSRNLKSDLTVSELFYTSQLCVRVNNEIQKMCLILNTSNNVQSL
jgi:hypothetical protein